jgi:hypothetical protein
MQIENKLASEKKSLRQVIVMCDFSENMTDGDYKPSRVSCVLENLHVG